MLDYFGWFRGDLSVSDPFDFVDYLKPLMVHLELETAT
jgi:hypothetical protein